jgi:hypothetical protein
MSVIFKNYEKLVLFIVSHVLDGCSQRGTEVAHNIFTDGHSLWVQRACLPDKKVIKFLLYVHVVKINDPWGGANFDTSGKIWTILVEYL